MDSYNETFETWNKVAQLYQDQFMDLDLYNESYDIFCKQLTHVNAAILEIGCGPGNITKYMLSKRPDLLIEGIDVAPNMIELAKKNNPTTNFKVMDCRQINKLTTEFDGIVCGFCLPYLSKFDCSKLFTDCNKLLATNGIIYFSFVEGDYNNSGYLAASSGDRTFFYYHELESLKKDLTENHFEIVNLSRVHYKKNDGSLEENTIIIAKIS